VEIVSKIDPIATLEYLAKTKEHQYLERKGIDERGITPGKVSNEVIGMLNADGGILALGISDEGVVQDLSKLDEDLLSRYEKLTHEFIKPPARVKLEKLTGPKGELIFLYHVAQDYENLYERKDNHDVYKRISDSNYGPLNNDEIEQLRHDKNLRRFEEQDCLGFNPEDLDVELVESYRKKINYVGSTEDLLVKRNLAERDKHGKLVLRNSAVLLFSKDPDKYIPSSYVRYVRYEGTEAGAGQNFNVVKDLRIEGNIPHVIDEVRKLLNTSLDDYFFLDINTGIFRAIPEYPEGAWLEGIVNALFHRSYNLQGNCTYIKHYDDRLEISNSGPLPAQVTVENIRTQRFSRNPRIGRVLTEMGYVRELNEGVNRIYQYMEESMLSEPRYIDKDNIVQLVLENKISNHKRAIPDEIMRLISGKWEQYSKTEHLIFEKLFKDQEATIAELADFCGVSEKAVRNYLNKLIEIQMIVKDSEKIRDRNAKYRFRKKDDA
jgi:ATP-dependent DNA helicase RecG